MKLQTVEFVAVSVYGVGIRWWFEIGGVPGWQLVEVAGGGRRVEVGCVAGFLRIGGELFGLFGR
ncbi:hypothetical protein [Mycobacterium attenuatum]|uniref:hypothetical protein n=1 Tax=Mycobacterium attenuatum TaxID=2341086 RepID=UPI000F01EA0D|nr:hypothetical protein [Mycobacterium attenuatum]